MRFSQRIGRTPVREAIQVDSMDEVLENRLWNCFIVDLLNKYGYSSDRRIKELTQICKLIWTEFLGKKVDEMPYSLRAGSTISGVIDYLKEWYIRSSWYEKYDFVEFLAFLDYKVLKCGFIDPCNLALKKEMSAYRIVEEKIVQITSDEEITEIENAFKVTSKWAPVNVHLSAALDLFSDRQNPDFRNSIKESISAIEALCRIIVGDNNTTLGAALSVIERKHNLHKALKSAFSSLYGFTSDSGGIRHSLSTDDVEVQMEDARFALITCSAFINYLKVKAEV